MITLLKTTIGPYQITLTDRSKESVKKYNMKPHEIIITKKGDPCRIHEEYRYYYHVSGDVQKVLNNVNKWVGKHGKAYALKALDAFWKEYIDEKKKDTLGV